MRVLLTTLVVTLCWLWGLSLWWRPAQSLIELSRPDWAMRYEKSYSPAGAVYSLSGAMQEFLRTTKPYRPLALYIREAMAERVVTGRLDDFPELAPLGEAQAPTTLRQYLDGASPRASHLDGEHGYLQLVQNSGRVILSYTRLGPNELAGREIPSRLRYPERNRALALAGLALALTVLAGTAVAGDRRLARSTAGRGSRASVVVACVGAGLAALPFYYGWVNESPPFVFVGGFIFLCGLIGLAMFGWLTVKVGHLLDGTETVVHWRYGADEWRRYVEWAYTEERQEKRQLLMLIGVISLVVGGGFWLLVRDEGGAIVFGVLVAILLLLAILVELVPRLVRRRDRHGDGEVLVGRSVLYLNGSVHCWTLPGSRLEGITFSERPLPHLKIRYSYLMMAGRSLYFFRNHVAATLPVPAGRGDEATRLVELLQAQVGRSPLKPER